MENHTVTKYDVFISYSRQDYVDEQKNVIPGNEVSKVKEALTSAGITYWFDEEGIYSGQNFVEKIVTNIENAKIFLFLSTANANKSPWTCKEIASADEFKKHIIPVRLDPSPYNKKVLFRIADLDYIEYFPNPQKGLEDMIKSIKAYLDELAAAERHKEEEEAKKKEAERKKEEEQKKQREQEEKRRQEEQKRLIAEIKLACTTLNNEEAKIDLDRDSLLKKAETIENEVQREDVKALIKKSGVVHLKYQKEYEALIERLNKQYEETEQLNQGNTLKLKEQEDRIKAQETELDTLRTKIVDFEANQAVNNQPVYEPTERDLMKWNWGAFFLSWIWCIRNKLDWWWVVLYLVLWCIPIINLISSCILGYMGTKYAWEKGRWNNWEHFQIVQREWKLYGFILMIAIIILVLIVLLIGKLG